MVGKIVMGSTYLHMSVFAKDIEMPQSVKKALSLLSEAERVDINVVRYSKKDEDVSLLVYKDFFDDEFPSLIKSWKLCTKIKGLSSRNYSNSKNPLILHRKELLILNDHPKYECYQFLTQALNEIGAFQDSHLIGRKKQWEHRLSSLGIFVKNHKIYPLESLDT